MLLHLSYLRDDLARKEVRGKSVKCGNSHRVYSFINAVHVTYQAQFKVLRMRDEQAEP